MPTPPVAGTELFTAAQLGDWIGGTVEPARAVMAEQVVWGWLQPVLGLTERPTETQANLFSWALELGAIAYENPTGLASYQLGEERSQYSAERRDAVLATAAAGGVNPAGSTASPRGSFPLAEPWADPLRRY